MGCGRVWHELQGWPEMEGGCSAAAYQLRAASMQAEEAGLGNQISAAACCCKIRVTHVAPRKLAISTFPALCSV